MNFFKEQEQITKLKRMHGVKEEESGGERRQRRREAKKDLEREREREKKKKKRKREKAGIKFKNIGGKMLGKSWQ